MCLDPVTLGITASQMMAASAAITVASAVASNQSQAAQAAAQAKAVQQNRDAEHMDAERQQQQAAEVAAGTTNAHAMQAYKDMASFDAIAGEAGGGVTPQRGAAAMGIQQGQDLATVASNARKTQGEITYSDIASGNKATQGLASIKQPSLTELGLTIAGAGANYGNAIYKQKTAKGTE